VIGQAVIEGLAVSVLPESALRPGMRVLRADDGFPDLPYTEIAVLKPGGQAHPAVDALERHVVGALDNIGTSYAAAAE
jgi:DNA-binding transcriptional LysR family regulator